MTAFKDLPLRERKASRTRLAIYEAGRELLREKSLAQIKIEEICERADISRGTFFSYFSRKKDLIIYAIRIWSIEAGWEMAGMPGETLGLACIETIFKRLGQSMGDDPFFWQELLAIRIFEPRTMHLLNQNKISMVTPGDKLLWFPDKPGIEDFPEGTIVTYLRENLEIAVDKGELPGAIPVDSVLISLTSILYGAPVMLAGYTELETLADEYTTQLKILWAGLRSLYL